MADQYRVTAYEILEKWNRDAMAKSLDEWSAAGWEPLPIGLQSGLAIVIFRKRSAEEAP